MDGFKHHFGPIIEFPQRSIKYLNILEVSIFVFSLLMFFVFLLLQKKDVFIIIQPCLQVDKLSSHEHQQALPFTPRRVLILAPISWKQHSCIFRDV